jgi:hypothetical protein
MCNVYDTRKLLAKHDLFADVPAVVKRLVVLVTKPVAG